MDIFWVILLIAVGISIAAAVWRGVYERKRTEAWRDIARRPGMQFLGERNQILSRCAHMRLFSVGRSRKVRNAVTVQAGDVCVTAGDFRYVTGSGKNSTTHHQTICVLESGSMNLPHCYLRPERRILDKLGSLFGGKDIDFEEDPAFSDAYVLQGENEEAVRKLFSPAVRAWFAEHKGRGIHFEARGNTLVVHWGKRCHPQEALELMDQALQVMKRLRSTAG